MKEAELRKLARCCCCQRLIGETEVPIFYVLTLERYAMDLSAVVRQSALETMVGSVVVAQALGPNEDLAKPLMIPRREMVCEKCSHIATVSRVALTPRITTQEVTVEGDDD
jgi:hypothetical protein